MSSKRPEGAILPPRLPKRGTAAALDALEDQATYAGLVLSGGTFVIDQAISIARLLGVVVKLD